LLINIYIGLYVLIELFLNLQLYLQKPPMKKDKIKEEKSFQLTYLTEQQVRDLINNEMPKVMGNIQKIMIENKITQSELATAIRSEQQHISYMLRNKGKGITYNVIMRMATALRVNISELAK